MTSKIKNKISNQDVCGVHFNNIVLSLKQPCFNSKKSQYLFKKKTNKFHRTQNVWAILAKRNDVLFLKCCVYTYVGRPLVYTMYNINETKKT